jgi:hypothetical protein
MKAQLKVDGGDGDLPSIPGISKPVKADIYPVDWTQLTWSVLLLSALLGIAIPFFIIINATGINNTFQKMLGKIRRK